MRTDRIVNRQNLKTKLANLEERTKSARPLIEAESQLKRAYFAGYKKRLSEEMEEEKAKHAQPEAAQDFAKPLSDEEMFALVKDAPNTDAERTIELAKQQYPELMAEQELLSKQSLEPGNQAKDQGSAQPNQETPIGTV